LCASPSGMPKQQWLAQTHRGQDQDASRKFISLAIAALVTEVWVSNRPIIAFRGLHQSEQRHRVVLPGLRAQLARVLHGFEPARAARVVRGASLGIQSTEVFREGRGLDKATSCRQLSGFTCGMVASLRPPPSRLLWAPGRFMGAAV
jgi:hypothetical protein